MSAPGDTVHASAAAVGGRGVLIRGRSGSGKSSLLLALLATVPDAVLVADDRVAVSAVAGRLSAAVPAAIAGRLEVRGLGIVHRPHISPVLVDVVVDLLPLEECPRLPAPGQRMTTLAGIAVPRVFIAIGAPDASVRVLAALAAFSGKFYDKSLI